MSEKDAEEIGDKAYKAADKLSDQAKEKGPVGQFFGWALDAATGRKARERLDYSDLEKNNPKKEK